MHAMSPSSVNGLKGIRVLLIEDDPYSRIALTALLVGDGAKVVVAESGRAALAVFGDAVFDVVLTDLGLPDIPGDVLVRALLARAAVRPRVVVMTGYGEPHLTRARESGADVILLKPVDWAALRAHLPREQLSAA
jgi:two-component system, chemotaxis family, CheB/CheR fusion protein